MKKRMSVLMLMVALVTGACCGGDKPKPDDSIFVSSDFPVKVGNWWQYQVRDSILSQTDTITVRVIKESKYSNNSVFHCVVEKHNQIVDSARLTMDNQYVIYQTLSPDFYSYFGEFYLKCPFSQNDQWNGLSNRDSIKATGIIENFNILGKEYKVFDIQREWNDQFYLKIQNIQLVKGVGIVRQKVYMWEPLQNQGFYLIDYHLE